MRLPRWASTQEDLLAYRLYRVLLAPSSQVADSGLRRRLSAAAAVLLLVLTLGAVPSLAVMLLLPSVFVGSPAVTILVLASMFVLYLGVRSRFGLTALRAFAFGGTALIWLMLTTGEDLSDMRFGMPLAFLPFVFGGFLSRWYGTLVVWLITLAGMAWCTVMTPDMTVLDGVIYTLLISLGGIGVAGLQYLSRRDRQDLERSLRAEAEARQAVTLAEESRTRMLLAAHHELRTPLNGILGPLELLELEELPPSSQELVEMGQRSAKRLHRLVEDLLVFVDARQGELGLEAVPTDLVGLIHELTPTCAARAQERGVGFHLDLPGGAVVSVDPRRTRQILAHVLQNAVLYTMTGTIDVRLVASPEAVTITVQDTGPGMDAEQLRLAFEPLRQGSEGVRRSSEGLGLGLAASRVLARAMGGDLEASSVKGEGTTVTLSLAA